MSADVRVAIVIKLKDVVAKFAKKKIGGFIDAKLFEAKVQQSVYDVFRTHEYNPNITFDLNLIGDYAEKHLEDTFVAYFNESDVVRRDELKRMIYLDAYQELKATTLDDKKIIYVCVQSILNTIEDNYLSETSNHLKYIANKVVDDLNDVIDRYSKEIESVIIYNNSFAQCIDTIQESTRYSLDYHYLNSQIGFYGREKDIQYLDEFINNSELDQPKDGVKVQYTIITGTGGMGKSKLLYHYKKMHEVEFDKKYVFLTHNKITELSSKTNFQYRRDLILIVDYASESAEELGELINKMINSTTVTHKIHFILLEREGYQSESISENISYLPNWFNKFKDKFDHDLALEYMYKKKSYALSPLEKDDYLNIIDNISNINEIDLSDKDKTDVYDRYTELSTNEKLRTPLILILLTDYFIDCKRRHRDFEINNADILMKYTIDRDRKHWLRTLCNNDEKEQEYVERLLMYATATGGWNFEELGGSLDKASKYILDNYESKKLLLGKFGSLIRNNKDEEFVLMPIEPDIIGEYFVIDYLLDQRDCRKIIKLLWKKSNFEYFLFRCIETYANNNNFLELVYKYNILQCEFSNLTASMYNALCFYQNTPSAEKTILKFEELLDEHSSEKEIVILYSEGLVNLSSIQNEIESQRTIDKLERLSKSYPHDKEIEYRYAIGLSNLVTIQNVINAKKTIDKVKKLSESNSHNEKIATVYAIGLMNLADKQEGMEYKKSIDKLESFIKTHPNNENIAIIYAQGLFNLSCKYTKGLFNLSIEEEAKECEKLIKKLENLRNAYLDNEEIALFYAQGLANLSNMMNAKKCCKIINELKKLAKAYINNEEIAVAYAKGLLHLSLKQEGIELIRTIDDLKKVNEFYPNNEEIAIQYSILLFNLSCDQEGIELERIIDKLEKLVKIHPKNEGIVLRYVKGLYNLSFYQKEMEYQKTLDRIKKFSECYLDNKEITILYKMASLNQLIKQDKLQALNLIKK